MSTVFEAVRIADGARVALKILRPELTRSPEIVEQFYGKTKTPVDPVPERAVVAMAETRRNPQRFDHHKLFPGSAWEFTKWDRVDTVGFFVCCAVSGAIFGRLPCCCTR